MAEVAAAEALRCSLAFRGDVSSWNSEKERQLKLSISERCNLNMPTERINVSSTGTGKRKRARCPEEGSSVTVTVEISEKGLIEVNSSLETSSDDEREEEVEEIASQVERKLNTFFKRLSGLAEVHVTVDFFDEFKYRYGTDPR